jgi:hypothetical protein
MKRHHPGLFSQPHGRPTIAPVGELGWLTPLRPTAGDAASYIFRCRCGTQVTRVARFVRKSLREGSVPRCSPKCTGVPPTQNQPAGLGSAPEQA